VLQVITPLTGILVAIGIREGALTVTQVVLPLAFIAGTIEPEHTSLAMFFI
jgi:hypothetical protein